MDASHTDEPVPSVSALPTRPSTGNPVPELQATPGAGIDKDEPTRQPTDETGDDEEDARVHRLERPKLGLRQTSGTIIIPRDSPTVEIKAETYPANDARAMSPRRPSDEIEKMGDDARAVLEAQAKELQASLLEIVDKVEEVKSEHERLEGGNKFLQSYIGELMQTSKITSSGTGRAKGKGNRSNK